MSETKELKPINYQDYPEYMFALIASFLPCKKGEDLRRVAGTTIIKHVDKKGNTYKNGTLHSYDDKPAISNTKVQMWYKDGKLHREPDKPAYICGNRLEWYRN